MEEPTHLSDAEAFRESSLNGLVELQRFLAEELADLDTAPINLQRSFRPLTDGLGLEVPKRKEDGVNAALAKPLPTPDLSHRFFGGEEPEEPSTAPSVPLAEETVEMAAPARRESKGTEGSARLVKAEIAAKATEVEKIASPAVSETVEVTRSLATPPPMPQPTLFRRLQAGLIDAIFVLGLFGAALVITANLLTGFTAGFSLQVFREFSSPLFLRFAALEFTTLWLSYFAFGIGLLDMTFGMWVWGIRVSYGEPPESRFARKVSRIVFSFLFFAPIFPSILLLFRVKGRNLLDSISGTGLYRTGG